MHSTTRRLALVGILVALGVTAFAKPHGSWSSGGGGSGGGGGGWSSGGNKISISAWPSSGGWSSGGGGGSSSGGWKSGGGSGWQSGGGGGGSGWKSGGGGGSGWQSGGGGGSGWSSGGSSGWPSGGGGGSSAWKLSSGGGGGGGSGWSSALSGLSGWKSQALSSLSSGWKSGGGGSGGGWSSGGGGGGSGWKSGGGGGSSGWQSGGGSGGSGWSLGGGSSSAWPSKSSSGWSSGGSGGGGAGSGAGSGGGGGSGSGLVPTNIQMVSQYIQTGLPYYQQPVYSYEELQMMQQRVPHVQGYYDLNYTPTSLGAGRDNLGSVAYSTMTDGRFARTDNNSSPVSNVSSTMSQQAGSSAPMLNVPYAYFYGGNVMPGGFQYGTPAIYPQQIPTANTASGGQFPKPSYSAGYGSTNYDTLSQTTQDYSKGGYSSSVNQQTKTQTVSNQPQAGTASDLTSSMYGKGHVALNKSYEKQSFHSGTPPPFNMANTQTAGGTSAQPYGMYLPMPAAGHHNMIHQPIHQVGSEMQQVIVIRGCENQFVEFGTPVEFNHEQVWRDPRYVGGGPQPESEYCDEECNYYVEEEP